MRAKRFRAMGRILHSRHARGATGCHDDEETS
jgi:hypothetical protein